MFLPYLGIFIFRFLGNLTLRVTKGGPGTPGSNYWIVTVQTGSVKPLLDLKGSIMEPFICITSDGERIYFPLWECTGDLWMASLFSDR